MEVIVDDLLADPQYLDEAEENPALKELIVEQLQLTGAIYSILVRHGVDMDYIKILDDRALNDIFSVAKWTAHKHALRQKLVKWEGSALFCKGGNSGECQHHCSSNASTIHDTAPEEAENQQTTAATPGPSKYNFLTTSVTRKLLDDLVTKNEKGKIVQNYYDSHKNLDFEHRKSLSHVIVDFYLANNSYFSLPDMKRFSEIISEKFPSEMAALYYSPRNKQAEKNNPSGLLYDRFHNRNKKRGLKRSGKENEEDLSADFKKLYKQALGLTEQEVAYYGPDKSWLRNNKAPADEVLKRWNDTFLPRLKCILQEKDLNRNSTFDQWPRFLDREGYLLVDEDFSNLISDETRSKGFYDGWEKFAIDFHEYLRQSSINDKNCISLLKALDEGNLQQDCRDYLLCNLFHAIIKPVRTSENKLPSIAQAQLDVCYLCENDEEYSSVLQSTREEYEQANLPFFPKIFIVRNKNDPMQFYVASAKLQYQLPSFLRSIDVALKLKFVLDIPFPESCELFWTFLSRFFYEINYKRKSKNNQLLLLQKFLKDRQ